MAQATSLLSKAKIATKLSPQKMVVEMGAKMMNQIAKVNALALGALAMWLAQFGAAVLKAAAIGAAIGAGVGMGVGGFMGLQIALATGPFAPAVALVTVPAGMFLGGTAGAFVGGLTAGLIAAGMQLGSATMVSMGVGAGIGAVIGGIAGAVAGAAIGTAIGTGLAFITFGLTTPLIPVFTAMGATIGMSVGTVAGSLAGAYVGKIVGQSIVTPATDFVGGAYNTLTGGAKGTTGAVGGIPGVVGGFFSAVGNAIATGAAAIWNGAVGVAGGAFSGLASGLNFVVGSLTSTGVPASVVAVPVIGTAVGIPVVATVVGITVATSFFSPQQDFVIGGTGDNEIYTISKTASDGHFENDELPQEITYTIKLTAKADLSSISIDDRIEVRRKTSSFVVSRDTDSKLIDPPCGGVQTLATGSDWTCQFKIAAKSPDFEDSVITNTVTVTASPQGQAPVTDTAFFVTTVGKPPVGCPNDWPTDHGYISGGPEGTITHQIETDQGWPAIDIAATGMTYTTFAGRVKTVVNDDWGGGFGTYVTIEADCDGKRFEALWSHMKQDSLDPAIKVGAEVGVHQVIGEIDDTGDSEGNHVHYAFHGLEMKEPYIPKNPKSDDCTSKETCDVEW